MVEGKRLRNYLVYGIGEIILVVIGIMMALGINNWKQEQTDLKELNRIVTVIKSDLEADLREAKEIIESSEADQKLIVKMLYDPKFKDSIRDCEDCRYIMSRVYVPNFNSNGYDLLSNFNKDVKTNNTQVDSIIKFYNY
jgi:ABC-type antimicrobial peptide transport system permease subunit